MDIPEHLSKERKHKLVGVVLAGGNSSRMNQDKALLEFNSKSMLERTISVVKKLNVDKVVVCRNDQNPAHLADVYPNCGPLSGIHSAANYCLDANLLVVPIDLPFITSQTLASLVDQGQNQQVSCYYKNNSLPVFLRNTQELRDTLEHRLKSAHALLTKNLSVKSLLAELDALALEITTQLSMYNTNTPQQWQFAVQTLQKSLLKRQVGKL